MQNVQCLSFKTALSGIVRHYKPAKNPSVPVSLCIVQMSCHGHTLQHLNCNLNKLGPKPCVLYLHENVGIPISCLCKAQQHHHCTVLYMSSPSYKTPVTLYLVPLLVEKESSSCLYSLWYNSQSDVSNLLVR